MMAKGNSLITMITVVQYRGGITLVWPGGQAMKAQFA